MLSLGGDFLGPGGPPSPALALTVTVTVTITVPSLRTPTPPPRVPLPCLLPLLPAPWGPRWSWTADSFSRSPMSQGNKVVWSPQPTCSWLPSPWGKSHRQKEDWATCEGDPGPHLGRGLLIHVSPRVS